MKSKKSKKTSFILLISRSAAIQHILKECDKTGLQDKFTGVAFVTLKYEQWAKEMIHKQEKSWF
jgi:hypothetical protein